MTNNGNGDFKGKVYEWRGYVTRALEEMDIKFKGFTDAVNSLEAKFEHNNEETQNLVTSEMGKLTELISKNKDEMKKDMNYTNKRVNKLYLKVVSLATGVGVLVSIAFKLFVDKVF